MGKALSFTGHRPNKLGGYSGPRAEKIQDTLYSHLINIIKRAYKNGFETFISGGALGIDQIAAAAAIYLKQEGLPIKLIIAKPFPSQACKWPQRSQAVLDWLCGLADDVINVSDDPYTPEKMQDRNKWMVLNSDAVCAVYNGGNGGTGNCVRFALSVHKPVLIINPYTLEEKWKLVPKQRF